MTSSVALLREIERIASERDRLERQKLRTDRAIARAIAMLRERPEREVA